MPIGRASGQITAPDINLELGRVYNNTVSLDSDASLFSSTAGTPFPSNSPTNMSGFGGTNGYWGATYASAYLNNGFVNTTSSLPSEMQLDYSTEWSISFFVKMANTTSPIATGYQPTTWYTGTTTFGVNTIQFFYEGKLSNGTYSNKFIARMTRAGYASGRRDYRWDMGTNGIFTNGNGWNASDYPDWYHMVLTYDGGGASSGAFKLYINGSLMTVTTNNSTTDSTSTWTYSGNERLWLGVGGFNLGVPTQWYYSGVMWFDRELISEEVTTLYNSGAGVGANAVDTDYHWWGLSTNTEDRVGSYGIPVTFSNYNFNNISGSLSYDTEVRPSY